MSGIPSGSSGARLIRPSQCAYCGTLIAATAEKAVLEFELFRRINPGGTRYDVTCCSSAHMGHMMERIAASLLATEKSHHQDTERWAGGHNIKVATPKAND